MTRQCKRCGDRYEVREVVDIHCIRCGVEVANLIAADEKRRTRFQWSKPMDGWRPAA